MPGYIRMPHVDQKIKANQRDHSKSPHADDALPVHHFRNPAAGELEWIGTANIGRGGERVQYEVEHNNDEIDPCISKH